MTAPSARTNRVTGTILLVVGLLLVIGIGVITFAMYPLLSDPGVQTSGGSTFTGTAEQARMILSLFVVVILFGALSAGIGAFQVATGRRNRAMVLGMVALFVVMVFVALGSSLALGS